jgi:hypothetical protein
VRARMSRICFAGIAAGLLLPGLPGTSSAAAPVCTADPALYELPAGLTWTNPRAPCSDADGDAITIEVVDPPDYGTLQPDGAQAIDVRRLYTAKPDAAGNRDSMKFVAVANGEQSNEFQVDVWILPAHSAPVCTDLAITVRAGSSIPIAPHCVDADGDAFAMTVVGAPKHGTYDPARRTYTAARRYAGQDSMTFAVIDEWRLASATRKITITVTRAPGQRPLVRDKTAPKLVLKARSPLRARSALRRGIRLTAVTSEPGRVVIEAFIDRKTADRLGIDTRVGSVARDLAAGRTSVRLKLYRDMRGQLAGLKRVKLRLVARMVDAAGNLSTKRLRIKLKNDT